MQEVTRSLANDYCFAVCGLIFVFHLSFCLNEHVSTVFGSFPAPRNCSTLLWTLNKSSLNLLKARTLGSIISSFADAEIKCHFCYTKLPQLSVCWNAVLPSC